MIQFKNAAALRRFLSIAILTSGISLAAPAAATETPAEAAKPVLSKVEKPVLSSVERPATGGVIEPAADTKADPNFRSLFLSWKKLDQVGAQRASVQIPSQRPVDRLLFTSNFGFRSDPFGRGRRMHAGVDIPGPVGTPIYATADAMVGRAGRVGGYGNLVELEHGTGIQTRYGHLSEILVRPYQKVKRGDLIGRMGSTGRSTGSHLHYEVRLDGRAVNPLPFLNSSDYLVALGNRDKSDDLAMLGSGHEHD